MQWLSTTCYVPPEPPWLCMACYKEVGVANVRLSDPARNDAIVEIRLCEGCTKLAQEGLLDLTRRP